MATENFREELFNDDSSSYIDSNTIYYKYSIINIIRNSDNYNIYSYKMKNFGTNDGIFFKKENEEWYWGGTDYMIPLFINLTKEEIFDDPRKERNNIDHTPLDI